MGESLIKSEVEKHEHSHIGHHQRRGGREVELMEGGNEIQGPKTENESQDHCKTATKNKGVENLEGAHLKQIRIEKE